MLGELEGACVDNAGVPVGTVGALVKTVIEGNEVGVRVGRVVGLAVGLLVSGVTVGEVKGVSEGALVDGCLVVGDI